MRLAFLINDIETEKAEFTTTALALAALRRGHDVFYVSVEGFAFDPDDEVRVFARTPQADDYDDREALLADLQREDAPVERLPVEDLDVLMLRNDPADDAAERPWAQSAGIIFGQMAKRRGVLVLNDPDGLAKAVNKVYFQLFPKAVRPKTLVTRDPDDVREFLESHGRDVVIKPFQGSGGESVFVVRTDDRANLNQIMDAVCKSGYMVVQEYLPDAAGHDTRLFLVNGEPLKVDGQYAALRRVASGEDLRSNMSAGGHAEGVELGETELRIAELVRPQLLQDGMFLVGLDIAGDHLIEVNVFSPGGLHSTQELTGVDFTPAIIEAIERKVEARAHYRQIFDNLTLATM